MQLPILQSSDRTLQMMQSQWSSIINPVLASPTNNTSVLKGISLVNGTVTVNHLLGQMMQGWFITDINGAATIFRSQPLNDKTLTLTSNAAVTVNIAVF